jgi:hypothetical protein
VGPKKDRADVEKLLAELGYEMVGGHGVTIGVWDARSIFRDPVGGMEVDLFIDELAFCHRIDLRRRLDHHQVTIPPEDLFLSKAQIVEITRNDLVDMAVLLASQAVTVGQLRVGLDLEYLANTVTREWGFYRTVTGNLAGVREFARNEEALRADMEMIDGCISIIERELERAPKGVRFKARAVIGDRVRWYEEVGEGVRE